MAMAMFKRKSARTIPDNLRAPHVKMWGVSRQKGPESSHHELCPEHHHSFFVAILFSSLCASGTAFALCLSKIFGGNNQERKSSPKSKFWGRICRGRPRGYPGGRPGAKTSVRLSKFWRNKHFGADIHDPKARTSMTRGGVQNNFSQNNFWLNFRSLKRRLRKGPQTKKGTAIYDILQQIYDDSKL